MTTIKTERSEQLDILPHPVDGPSDDLMKKRKRKIFLWAILWAVFPPILIFVFLAAIIRPAIKGREPSGINYVFWILGLILLAALFKLPFGSFDTIADALKKPELCRAILFADGLATVVSIFLIVLTFRNKISNPFVPIKKFRIDKQIIVLWLLPMFPLLILFSSKSPFQNQDKIIHPLFAALASSLRSGSYSAVVIGLLSIGFFGPVLEEIIFRGMLLEDSHERERSKGMRYFLDFVVCLFFALLHAPVSFIVPFLFAVAFIYVRRRSGSLVPSILMHATWNSSILVILLMTKQNI